MLRRSPVRIATLLAAGAVALAGCASGSGTPNTSTASSNLSTVTVTGARGAKPTMKVPSPFTVTRTDRRVITPGTGGMVAPGERISIDYVGVNGTDGKEFDTSFGKSGSATFLLNEGAVIRGMVSGLSGVTVGSRVLIAIPPKDGYGTQGAPSAGIGPTDTLVFVVDVKSAGQVLKRAIGTPVKPAAGLPTVTVEPSSGKPTIKVPAVRPPAKLVAQQLVLGKGAKVAKGDTITVHYTGVVWATGKQFDSSWDKGSPVPITIGTGSVIPGWDESLVGRTVGSQLLLVIPPDKGYGANGNATAGIKGTDTLVFVVDILDTTPA